MRYNEAMVADWLLMLIGENPSSFQDQEAKWAVIAADAVDSLLPLVLFLLIFLPLIILRLFHKRFTILKVLVALAVGLLLAGLGYWLNLLSLDLGQAAVFWAIYGK